MNATISSCPSSKVRIRLKCFATTLTHFLDPQNILTVSLWPNPIVQTIKHAWPAELLPWQKVPHNYDDLCDWAYVSHPKDLPNTKHKYYILYKAPPTENNKLWPITLQVQGFLQNFNLGALGNWNG